MEFYIKHVWWLWFEIGEGLAQWAAGDQSHWQSVLQECSDKQLWMTKCGAASIKEFLEPSCERLEQNVRKLAAVTFVLNNTCKPSFSLFWFKEKGWKMWTELRSVETVMASPPACVNPDSCLLPGRRLFRCLAWCWEAGEKPPAAKIMDAHSNRFHPSCAQGPAGAGY